MTARRPSDSSVAARLTAMAGIALVLGAGGTVGHAFHAGVLTALADVRGWDARRADVLVGTSAGSIVSALLRAGMPPTDLLQRGSRLPLSDEGEAVVRRAGLGPPRPRPPRPRPSGSIASPTRLPVPRRAPWPVSPGSLAAAVLPEGQVPTENMAVPFDNLYGERWPSRADVDRRRAARHRPARRVRPAGRAAGARRRGGAGVVRHPGVLRAGRDRRPALRRRRRALDDQRRPRRRRASGPRARQRADVSGARRCAALDPATRDAPVSPVCRSLARSPRCAGGASRSWRSSRRPPTSR